MEFTKLIVEKKDGYVVAAINHPPANAMAQGVLKDLNALLDQCLEDDGVRAIVITGSEKSCSLPGLISPNLPIIRPEVNRKSAG